MIPLDENARWSILNALKTAADAYRRDADLQLGKLKTQFLRQADEAMALYERIEQAEAIMLTGMPGPDVEEIPIAGAEGLFHGHYLGESG